MKSSESPTDDGAQFDIEELAHRYEAFFQHGPSAVANLAYMLRRKGKLAEAVVLADHVLRSTGISAEIAAILGEAWSSLPGFHHAILQDLRRNDIYERSIGRAVFPGCRVLEIGTGSGLLAMMAARCGAGEVFSCERDPLMAEIAREIVRQNGFADRVTVLNKSAADLVPGVDLPGRADVFVAEIYSNDIVGQGCLDILPATLPHLLRDDARIVPRLGAVCVSLARYEGRRQRKPLGQVSGFDLTLLDPIADRCILLPSDAGIALASTSAELFRFEFSGVEHVHAKRSVSVTANGMPCNGVLQWIRLEMDDHEDYENTPGRGQQSCWALRFYPFRREVCPVPGESVEILGLSSNQALRIWSPIG